jgi:hypothetical protein
LGFARERARRGLLAEEPLLGWLALDGAGFHDGFFHAQRVVVERARAPRLTEPAARAYDQGVGRSLWFFHGAERERIAETLARFEQERRGELWSGVGLACAYAAGEDETLVRALLDAAGAWRAHFAQGVAFAVEARACADNPTPETAAVARLVWGRSCAELARVVALALEESEGAGGRTRYESWRAALRDRFEARAGITEGGEARVRAG